MVSGLTRNDSVNRYAGCAESINQDPAVGQKAVAITGAGLEDSN